MLPAVQVRRLTGLVQTQRLEAREEGEEMDVAKLVDWKEGGQGGLMRPPSQLRSPAHSWPAPTF